MLPIIARCIWTAVTSIGGYFGWEPVSGSQEAGEKVVSAVLTGLVGLGTTYLPQLYKLFKKRAAAFPLFFLLGCASLPIQELQEAQRHAQEACKVIEQLPPIPDGPQAGGEVEDQPEVQPAPPGTGEEPGAPPEPASAPTS